MRAAKGVLALIVLSVAAMAILREPANRQRCNREKASTEQLILRLDPLPPLARRDHALPAIERLGRCSAELQDDWQIFFLLGELHKIAGNRNAAMTNYRAALDLEHRPETYAAISLLHFESGEPVEAVVNAEKAAAFNIFFANYFDPSVQQRVRANIEERRRREP